MRKIIIIFMLGLFIILLGCSGNQPKNAPPAPAPPSPPATSTDNTTSQQRVLTMDELKTFNGQNGTPVYVAVDGVIYDVTKSPTWKNGLHKACSSASSAGTDFSELIKSSPHGTKVLNKFPVVGTLQK